MLSLCGGVETGLYALQKLGIPVKEYHTYEILPEAIAVSHGFDTRELMDKWKDCEISIHKDRLLFLDMIVKE